MYVEGGEGMEVGCIIWRVSEVTKISTDGEIERGDKAVAGDDAELQTVKAPGVTLKVTWERPQSI